jgi:hypothetical protein
MWGILCSAEPNAIESIGTASAIVIAACFDDLGREVAGSWRASEQVAAFDDLHLAQGLINDVLEVGSVESEIQIARYEQPGRAYRLK